MNKAKRETEISQFTTWQDIMKILSTYKYIIWPENCISNKTKIHT
jgi:hypothetical protein